MIVQVRGIFGDPAPCRTFMASTIDLPLFDVLRSSASRRARHTGLDADERFLSIVEQFVAAALAEYRHIDFLDRSARSHAEDPFDRQTAALLRQRYDRWAADAEALLERITPAMRVPGVRDLEDAVGRTRAMLSVSLDAIDRAAEQVKRGESIPLAEVRRELRDGPQR